jgi:hypothetical protein
MPGPTGGILSPFFFFILLPVPGAGYPSLSAASRKYDIVSGRCPKVFSLPVPEAHRPPEIHSFRSRHSRAAASPPASLPALTVPRRVRLGRAPRRTGRIDSLGARPLQERTSGGRGASLANASDLATARCHSARRNSFASLHRPPASTGPFRQIPAFDGRCIRPGIVALPRRTAAGTSRSGALPEAAHRPSRCTASSGTAPWTPASPRCAWAPGGTYEYVAVFRKRST